MPIITRFRRFAIAVLLAPVASPAALGAQGAQLPPPLEEAIRKMTSWPATRMRLASRGVIREGNWADVTVFDLATLQDRATYQRPFDYPTGVEWVLVNGVVTIDHGKHTGARAGQVLYGPGRQALQSPASK